MASLNERIKESTKEVKVEKLQTNDTKTRVIADEKKIPRIQNRNRRNEHYENPAKIKVKKEDVLCHVSIFASFMIIYFISVVYSSHNKVEIHNKVKITPSSLSDILNDLQKDDFVTVEPHLPKNQVILESSGTENGLGCSLYIADSSLPNSGFGIFTMKPVKKGDLLIPQSKGFEVNGVHISPHMMFMKQHSLYYNVNGGIDGSVIVASKDIEEGEEIFFKFEDYSPDFMTIYQSVHAKDPTLELFDKVDNITKAIIESIPMKKVSVKKKKNKNYKQKKEIEKYIEKPIIDGTAIIQVFKDTLEDYDSFLANLLPDTHSEATSMIEAGGKAMFISNKRSPHWLSKNGVCVDGVRSSKSDRGTLAARPVSKGDVVTTSPLYAILNRNHSENCFCVNTDGLVLCPLSFFSSYANEGLSASECDIESRNDCPKNVANAHYQWSKFNNFNNKVGELSAEDLVQSPLTGLTIDIIASRDIDEGEEIFIKHLSNDEEHQSCIKLSNKLLPSKWN